MPLTPSVDLRQFESRPFLSEPFIVALPLDHPLVDLDTVDLNLLDDQPFIMFSPDAARYFHDLLTNAFDAAQILPKIVHQVGQMHSMLALVDVGFGAALVPQSAER